MKKRIAIVGTFDVKNYGDLLFPLVFSTHFQDYLVDKFSPEGTENGIFGLGPVYPISALEKRLANGMYDAIVIGGGDIIRLDKNSAYATDDAFICWQLPIVLGAKYRVPVVMNAPGVPFAFEKKDKDLLKKTFALVDYVSVRDENSRRFLQSLGVDAAVVPDTVLSIQKVYATEFLKEKFRLLCQEGRLGDAERYIVFQHNCVHGDDEVYLDYLREYLKELSKEKQCKILLFPIGYVHKDEVFLKKLANCECPEFILPDGEFDVVEMSAILANSIGYIGTSMHGTVVSYSYGKTAICLNDAHYEKVHGLMREIGHPEWDVDSIYALPNIIQSTWQNPSDNTVIMERIQKHFDTMQSVIESEYTPKQGIDAYLLAAYYAASAGQRDSSHLEKAKVYLDMGTGYSEDNCIEIAYSGESAFEITVDIPVGTQKLRIDPVENSILQVHSKVCEIDGICVPLVSPQAFQHNNSEYLLSLDPYYEAECSPADKRKRMVFSISAEPVGQEKLIEMIGALNYQQRLTELALSHKESEYEARILKLSKDLKDKEERIQNMENSILGKLYLLAKKGKKFLSRVMEKNRYTRRIKKGISILRHQGFKAFLIKLRSFLDKKRRISEYQSIMGNDLANYSSAEQVNHYDSEYQENVVYGDGETDVKALAFYLPQFHTFPENDEWWGKGFTEWTNVRKGDSRFEGHYQPRVPHKDFGYYCLEDINVLRKQAELAKQHGIYGFCFYYYWFSGKRLMEKPVDMLLEHKEIDLPFCLCWANENWTRAWDGQNKNVLIAQEYSDKDDEQFIVDLKKYLDDERYIRVNGKPVIIVYNPGQIPNCQKTFSKWREKARELGIGEILLWTCQTANNTAKCLGIEKYVDADVEFAPHNMWMEEVAVRDVELNGRSAYIFDYQLLSRYMEKKLKNEEKGELPIYHCCMMAWDNAARRKDAWFTYYNFSLKSLYRWVLAIVDRARKDFEPEERFMFINAWNEWGEGTYLEPDEKYGYANINTVSKALFDQPFEEDLSILSLENEPASNALFPDQNAHIAVQVHMFYLDVLDETIDQLNKIPYTFDCYISTDTTEKKLQIEKALNAKCKCSNAYVVVFDNRGRDVAPFLCQMASHMEEYEYICHIHSKKTKTADYGNDWREYIFKHLFGSPEYLKRIFALFEKDPNLGLVMPETYPVLELQAEWGGNAEGVRNLMNSMFGDVELPNVPIFPVGNMFWARSAAVKKLFALNLKQEDFPPEEGQVNATIAHQIERSWVYVAREAGFSYRKVFNNCFIGRELTDKTRLGVFAHYNADAGISEDDYATVQAYSKILSKIVFVSNSPLTQADKQKLDKMQICYMERKNEGFDFSAWRDGLFKIGRETVQTYDELVLFNNSCYPPVFDLQEMFEKMETISVDFWGSTIFPYSPDGSYIHREFIPEHVQSFLMVFNKKVLQEDVFWKFWSEIKDYSTLIDVISNGESQLTWILSNAGYTYEPYIRETYYLSKLLNNYAIAYEKPSTLLLLSDPLIKKKCYQHMSPEERIRLEYLVSKMRPTKGCEKLDC